MSKLNDLQKTELLAIVDIIDGDGHTIFGAADFEHLLPADLLARFTRTIKSDRSSPKSTIFGPGGQVVAQVRGVYGLTLLAGIADALGLPPSTMLGRGSEARDLTRRIREALEARQ